MQIISPQQILLPKKVYIGDKAELRCTFNSPSTQLKQMTAGGSTELPLVSQNNSVDLSSEELFAIPHKDYEIQKITLSPAGVDYYQFTITFVPWKTGELRLPPMELEGTELILEFQPVQIVSMLSTDSAAGTSLHDSAAPLLLPGTAYKLYGALAASIIILIVLIRIIIKRKNLLFYINQKRLLRKYKKNKKQTLKQLKHASSAEELQKIMRNYLEVRFSYPFTRCVTSEMMRGWQTATSGLLSDTKTEAFGDIVASFIRTDFIRYSKNGSFAAGELEDLIKTLSVRIESLESSETENKENKTEGEALD